MTSISGDTQLGPVPEVLCCHPARVGGDTPHGILTCLWSGHFCTRPRRGEASPQTQMHSLVRSQWLGHY